MIGVQETDNPVGLKWSQRVMYVLAVTCGFFLLLPLVVYALNMKSVAIPKDTILACGGMIVCFLSCLLLLLAKIPRLRKYVDTVCLISLPSLVVLLAFPNFTGPMSGFVESMSIADDFLAFIKILAVGAAGFWLAGKNISTLRWISDSALVVVLALTGYIAAVPISTADKAPSPQVKDPEAAFTQLGQSKNVVVVIFDSFTGQRMSEVLNEHPALRNDLDGFIHYPAALASAMSTPAGIGAILTGDLTTSLEIESIDARLNENLSVSFLADGKRKGMNTRFISTLVPTESEISHKPEHYFFTQHPRSAFNGFPAYFGFLVASASRVMPSIVCDVAEKASDAVVSFSRKRTNSDWELLQSLPKHDRRAQYAKMALDYFIDNLHVKEGASSVLVLHSMVTHPAYHLAADGTYQDATDDSFAGTSVFATRELARLCAKLKALGVYESTLLIAVADHGSMPIKDKTMGGRFVPPGLMPVDFNPLLMVKPPGAHGPCRESSMTVWLGDVAATVRDFLGVRSEVKNRFHTYSLLQSEWRERTVNIPVFFRPDHVHHYSSLAQWVRKDYSGSFHQYGALFSDISKSMAQSTRR